MRKYIFVMCYIYFYLLTWFIYIYIKIRVYDTKKARRPILSVEIGEYPIRSLTLNKDRSQAIFSDTVGTVTTVDVSTGKALGTFKGFAGSVSDVWGNPEDDILATVSLDRHLRVFSTLGKRPLLHKVNTTLFMNLNYNIFNIKWKWNQF